jgi:hypothetical protein
MKKNEKKWGKNGKKMEKKGKKMEKSKKIFFVQPLEILHKICIEYESTL